MRNQLGSSTRYLAKYTDARLLLREFWIRWNLATSFCAAPVSSPRQKISEKLLSASRSSGGHCAGVLQWLAVEEPAKITGAREIHVRPGLQSDKLSHSRLALKG